MLVTWLNLRLNHGLGGSLPQFFIEFVHFEGAGLVFQGKLHDYVGGELDEGAEDVGPVFVVECQQFLRLRHRWIDALKQTLCLIIGRALTPQQRQALEPLNSDHVLVAAWNFSEELGEVGSFDPVL